VPPRASFLLLAHTIPIWITLNFPSKGHFCHLLNNIRLIDLSSQIVELGEKDTTAEDLGFDFILNNLNSCG
jgi:hypothetical protein